MKIVLVSPLPPPEGGIATWTVKYQQYCRDHGIPLSVVNIALQGGRARKINSKRQLLSEVKRTAYVLRELNRQLRTQRPDLVHLNSSCSRFGIFRDLLCLLLADLKEVPVVFHCRCNIQDQLKGRAGRLAFGLMARRAAKVLTLNQRSFDYASQYTAGNVLTVPNFIEDQVLSSKARINDRIRKVVFVGHVQKTKGACEIIRAAAALPGIQFQLIGPVQSEIAQQPITPNVTLCGTRSHHEVLDLLREADVFLFPSYSEGFANALTEAMACGLPAVATDVGANGEMLEQQGGIIVPVGDSDAIVAALQRLDADAGLRRAMSEWNIEKVRRCYLQNAVMQRLLTIYRDISGQVPRGRKQK